MKESQAHWDRQEELRAAREREIREARREAEQQEVDRRRERRYARVAAEEERFEAGMAEEMNAEEHARLRQRVAAAMYPEFDRIRAMEEELAAHYAAGVPEVVPEVDLEAGVIAEVIPTAEAEPTLEESLEVLVGAIGGVTLPSEAASNEGTPTSDEDSEGERRSPGYRLILEDIAAARRRSAREYAAHQVLLERARELEAGAASAPDDDPRTEIQRELAKVELLTERITGRRLTVDDPPEEPIDWEKILADDAE